jgi:hypothetical protein
MAERPIKPDNAANIIGVSEGQLLRRLDSANVEVSTLHYDDQKQQFPARTKGGQNKVAYVVETPRGKSVYFALPGSVNRIKTDPDKYPHLKETATAVYVPGLNTRKDLL